MKKPVFILCLFGLAWLLVGLQHVHPLAVDMASLAVTEGPDRIVQAASDHTEWSLLFADDFERGSWQWQVDEGYEVRAEAGNHMLHCTAVSGAPMARAGIAWDDYRAEVRVRVTSGNAVIGIRQGKLGAGYYLFLQADGALDLAKWDGSDWTTLANDPGPYAAGQWHILALEGEGSQLRAYVDGDLRLEASDASYAAGSVLLQTGWGEADYDDVWVTGDAPVACPVVPASGLNTPHGIALSPDGELYVYGTWICRIALDGTIERVANPACPGDIAFDSDGTLYFIECMGGLGRVLPDGSREYFANIWGWGSMAIGPGDEILVSVGRAGNIFRVYLDGSTELLYTDVGGELAFDPSGNLFSASGSLYKITPAGDISVVADLSTGPGFMSLAVDEQGNAYLGQGMDWQRDPTQPPFVPPVNVDEVYRVSPDGELTVFAEVPGGAAGLAFGPDGTLYATEWNNAGVSRISSDGTVTPVVRGNGLALVEDIAYSSDGVLYMLNADGMTVGRVTAEGVVEIIASGLNLESTGESQPALAFDEAGNLYVGEAGLVETWTRITKFAPDGTASVFTNEIERPSGLAFHPTTGDLYVSEALSDQILRFSPSAVRTVFATGLENPHGIAFGPDGNLYVAEMPSNRVSRVTPSGEVSTFVSGIENPRDVTFSGSDLLIATGTHMVWQVATDGTVSPHASGPSDSRGITVAPDGSTVVSFVGANCIYRYTESESTPGLQVVAPAAGFGQPGQVVTHTFTIQNTGNGCDGYRLAAESGRGWPVEIQGAGFVAPIECGQTRSVQVAVSIPVGTGLGVSDVLTLTVASRLAPDVRESTQATTVCGHPPTPTPTPTPRRLYLPIILR